MQNFRITGLGMVTSLGHDVKTCCAAERAGIVRPSERDDFPVRSPEDGSVESLVVHTVPLLTEGFEEQARLQCLMAAGLKDLLRQCPLTPWMKAKTGFYLSLPDPRRVYTGLNLIPDDEDRKEKEEEASEIMAEPQDSVWAENLLDKAAKLSGWPGKPELKFITTAGNTGVAQALNKAIEDLKMGLIGVAVVGGVDSLLDEETLIWLGNTLRLKTPDMPVGLQPGEAAAFLTVEAPARGGDIKTLAHIQAMQVGTEERSLFSGETPLGEGLAALMNKATQRAGFDNSQAPWFITDQNGELYRAMEWGHAVVRLIKDWPGLDNAELWYPAMSFGDTGAASGAVAICLAIRAFECVYAPVENVYIISSNEASSRSVLIMQNLY